VPRYPGGSRPVHIYTHTIHRTTHWHNGTYITIIIFIYLPLYFFLSFLPKCREAKVRETTVQQKYSAFGKSLCTYKSCWKWCPRASIQTWIRLILFTNTSCRSAFGKSLCTYKRCRNWCPRASIQDWTRLILFANTFCRSAFGKSLCTYKRCWKCCPRASIQDWSRLILFANTFCRSACQMFLMNAVIAVLKSLRVRGRSRYTADFAAPYRSKCTAIFRTNCICCRCVYLQQKYTLSLCFYNENIHCPYVYLQLKYTLSLYLQQKFTLPQCVSTVKIYVIPVCICNRNISFPCVYLQQKYAL
jgi:hypothetical protein